MRNRQQGNPRFGELYTTKKVDGGVEHIYHDGLKVFVPNDHPGLDRAHLDAQSQAAVIRAQQIADRERWGLKTQAATLDKKNEEQVVKGAGRPLTTSAGVPADHIVKAAHELAMANAPMRPMRTKGGQPFNPPVLKKSRRKPANPRRNWL